MDPYRYLEEIGQFHIRPGLERIRHALKAFNDPHLEYPTVHIGGTNGKGSTASILDSILRECGLRPGLYTSPHLIRLTERFIFEGKEVDREELGSVLKLIIESQNELENDDRLTYFELLTCAFFLLGRKKRPDINIVEVGMGGRWDATNVVEPHAVCITNISLDHTEHLGDDSASIAMEKAGIIKPSTPVIIGPMPGSKKESLRSLRVLLDICSRNGCPVICIERPEMVETTVSIIQSMDLLDHMVLEVEKKEGDEFEIKCMSRPKEPLEPCMELIIDHLVGKHILKLKGVHQIYNAACAMCLSVFILPSAFAQRRIDQGDLSASEGLLNICPDDLTREMGNRELKEKISSGLTSTEIKGRMEIRNIKGRDVILDGGHNPDAARSLAESLKKDHPDRKVHLLLGMMRDKDVSDFAYHLVPIAKSITLVQLPFDRSMNILDLLKGVAPCLSHDKEAFTFRDMNEALKHWINHMDKDEDIGVCCGSLYLYQFLSDL